MISAERQAKLIAERANKKVIPHVPALYYINIVNNKYGKRYNFFFYSQIKYKMTHSVPIAILEKYDIEYLEKVVRELRKLTNLTFRYTDFEDQRWHSNGRLIR
ncbi:hypothetical protein [Liquorilactobacillus ghanensis]|uniref:hypothetical protein n=1 Tax=Liquorilactobacillus ghanensis TaxID=399370 RepID=UPI00070A36C3|nr:hypothetical protein [Liquorilactobacillus ghanensis]